MERKSKRRIPGIQLKRIEKNETTVEEKEKTSHLAEIVVGAVIIINDRTKIETESKTSAT